MTLRTKMKTFYHSEQGRSMIEMLGTLAIMGVLSIGGIAGYNYAIDKYRANETMEELNNRAIVYATQLKDGDLFSGTALRNGEFGDKTALGYGVSATVSEYENEFNVTLSEIPFEVCEQILKNYTIPTEISVNGNIYSDVDENIDICGEGNTDMVFAFNGDLSNDWEMVEVSGEPNNGETTVFQTGTILETGNCQNVHNGNCYEQVQKAEEYCTSRGGPVLLSQIGCELKTGDSTSHGCYALEKADPKYYVLGSIQFPIGFSNCLCGYKHYHFSGVNLDLYYHSSDGLPLCWDDYRAMLAESTGTGTYTESTTGTPTVSQTPTVTQTVTNTETQTETASQEVTISVDCSTYYYNNEVQQAYEYCNSKSGPVLLSEVGCELSGEEDTGTQCDAFDIIVKNYSSYTYYVVGTDYYKGHQYTGCMTKYGIRSDDGNSDKGFVHLGYGSTPLCWDDYRAMLADITQGGSSE